MLPLLVAGSVASAASPEVRAELLRLAALDAHDRIALREGEVLSRSIPTEIGHETASIHLARIDLPARYVIELYAAEGMAIETASAEESGNLDAARGAAAFAGLTIDDNDLSALARCSPGSCKVKLPRGWIHRFRGEIDWGDDGAEQHARSLYAQLLAGYVDNYRRHGREAMLRYEDKRDPVEASEQFSELLGSAAIVCESIPETCDYLRAPRQSDAEPATVLLWQKEDIGAGRRVTTLVEQVRLHDDTRPTLLVLGKQLYANHYYEGALTMTWVGPTEDGAGTLVVHALWARVDALRGWSLFSGRIHRGVRDGLSSRVASFRDRVEDHWARHQASLAR